MVMIAIILAVVFGFSTANADWTQIGSAGFSAGTANFISLALDSSGTPYVAYQDL